MPKNSSTLVLRRWRDLDYQLQRGVFIPGFARKWKVSEKTVRRDLDAFRELGQRIGHHLIGGDLAYRYVYCYRKGTRPLFRCKDCPARAPGFIPFT